MATPTKSHLLQMRGLKLDLSLCITQISSVASFTDAWIETIKILLRTEEKEVASFTDAWIETWKKNKETGQLEVASFTDAWIETFQH